MDRSLGVGSFVLCVALAACSSAAPPVPAEVRVGGAMPSAATVRVLPPDAPPEIASLWFNSLDVARGDEWAGRIETGSNVASVEVRSNLFSIAATRSGFGHFAFRTAVFDVPPIFIRGYKLRVIARNTAGEEAEVDLPFRIR